MSRLTRGTYRSLHRPKRIAFYDPYASYAGAGKKLHDMTQRLDRTRFEPLVVLAREGPLLDQLQGDGCMVEVVPPDASLNVYGKGLLRAGLLTKVRAAGALYRYSRRLAAWIREHEVDLLHCNDTRGALQAGLAARRAGVPMVWNVRSRERLPWYLVLLGSYCAKRLITLTEGNLDHFAGAGHLRRKSTVIPNGVDVDRFSPDVDGSAVRAEFGLAPDAPLILMVGTLVRIKAHEVLIRAARRILAAFPEARIVIVGGVPRDSDEGYRDELRQLCAALGLGKGVNLVGWRDDIPELMAACDLFVLPSRSEGFPAVVLEAMSSARPVVVTPPASAGVQEGVTGHIVPVDDDQELASAIADVLSDPERARQMGAQAREEVVAHYTVEAEVRRYEDVYWELLSSGGT